MRFARHTGADDATPSELSYSADETWLVAENGQLQRRRTP
jgi:hypothetical protein